MGSKECRQDDGKGVTGPQREGSRGCQGGCPVLTQGGRVTTPHVPALPQTRGAPEGPPLAPAGLCESAEATPPRAGGRGQCEAHGARQGHRRFTAGLSSAASSHPAGGCTCRLVQGRRPRAQCVQVSGGERRTGELCSA